MFFAMIVYLFLFVLGFICSLIVFSGRFEFEFQHVFVSAGLKFNRAFTFL